MSVSSTAYAPTPGSFVVDRLTSPGVRGSGWRAGAGDPQWISIDLQAACEVTSVRLGVEGDASDPVFTPPTTGNPADGTTGKEIQSSYSVDYVVEASTDHTSWTSVHRTTAGTGGVVNIQPPRPVTARWIRLTSNRRSNPNPLASTASRSTAPPWPPPVGHGLDRLGHPPRTRAEAGGRRGRHGPGGVRLAADARRLGRR